MTVEIQVSLQPDSTNGTLQVSLQPNSTNGTSQQAHCTAVTIYRSFLLRMRNGSDRSRTENQNARFTFNNFLFFLKRWRL